MSDDEDDQRDVIAFLRVVLSDDGVPPEEIVTHVSHIFLTKDQAFKLKRAVKFPFLDFRTCVARGRACADEVRINRRTAPSIYLGTRRVTFDGNDYAIDGKGASVDWLVEMRRFDGGTLFDKLAVKPKGLRRRMMEDLAVSIAAFHRDAERCTNSGGYAGTRLIAENNQASFARLGPDRFPATDADVVCANTLERINQAEDVLDTRRKSDRVRVCHGDLHLRNICLIDGKPTLFDAIEFSTDFSDIDVMYDLSFLLMDLEARGHRRLAAMVLNRYLDEGDEDASAFSVLPIFLSMRAQIRAHVGAAIALSQTDEGTREQELSTAQAYLVQGSDYLVSQPPRLVAVGGLSGSGKSRLARELAPHLDGICGARVVRSDAVRKNLAGTPLDELLGPDGYTPDMTAKTYTEVLEQGRQTLQAGQSVILDAVFAKPEQRAAAAHLAKELDVPFNGIWVDAAENIRVDRVTKRIGNVSDATAEVARSQSAYVLGDMTWSTVDSSGEKDRTVHVGLDVLGLSQ